MTDPAEHFNPEDGGHWEGTDVFVFEPPIVRGGSIIQSVDFAKVELQDDLTKEDVVSALLNPVHVATDDQWEDDEE